jgi:tocopherol cyclase
MASAGGGIASAIPFLNQYWHPYRLGGTATGELRFGTERWRFDDVKLYTERNWGAGFPDRWWWGQAHDFGDADVSVAFSGGLLALGPLRSDVGGVVVRLGDRVIRLTPPTAWVRPELDDQRWSVRATSMRYQVELEGDGTHLAPHVLPVPLPAERRNVNTDYEHLAGRLRCTVREFGRVIFEGKSELAGLEVGHLPG